MPWDYHTTMPLNSFSGIRELWKNGYAHIWPHLPEITAGFQCINGEIKTIYGLPFLPKFIAKIAIFFLFIKSLLTVKFF